MIRRKKKQRIRVGRIIFLSVFAAALLVSIYYWEIVLRYWSDVRRVIDTPDVASVLTTLRREPFGLFCIAPEECYVFDEKGIVFDKARSVVGDVIVKVEEGSDVAPRINEPFISDENWENVYPILLFIKNGGLAVNRMVLRSAERELTAYLPPSDTPVYFSLEFNPGEHLRAIKQLEKKISFADLQYLDLRVEGKIFYK